MPKPIQTNRLGKRDVVVRICVARAERAAMQGAADEQGVTLSAWIRARCVETVTTFKVAPPASDRITEARKPR